MSTSGGASATDGNRGTPVYSWYTKGWRPYIGSYISRVTNSVFKISGHASGSYLTYYFEPNNPDLFNLPDQPLVQVRPLDVNTVKLAFCWPFGKSYEVVAYINRESIPTPAPQPESEKLKPATFQDKIKAAVSKGPSTAMKEALLNAASKSGSSKP